MIESSNGKSVAILAADAVGYSYAVANDEPLALRALGASRRIIDATIEQHAGRIFNTAGDSVLAEFETPADAVRCALAIQQNLGRAAGTPLLAFRIGLHLGGVVAEGSDLLGATVNTAARLEAIAPAGGLCMSGEVHDALAGTLQLNVEDLGLRHLKNLIKPVRVFRVLPAGARSAEVVAEARKSRVMVLPLANSSGLPDETYLSEGITEDIIAGLSRFGLLAVLGMASSDAYRDQSPDLRSLVAELGVDYVVQGSVRRGGDTIRLSARLVDARSGLNVWGERYDRSTSNLFEVQDEISQTIVSTLAGQLEDEGAAAASRKRTENMEAYDFLLRGIHTARATDPRSAKAALQLFQKALALDPEYALALSWSALMKLRLWGWNPEAIDVNEISDAAERPRINMAFGFALQTFAGLWMLTFDLNVTMDILVLNSAVQGFAVGTVWVPMTMVAFDTLAPKDRAEASSVFHLLRNIGSSFFISLSIAEIVRTTGANYSRMTEMITPFNQALTMPGMTGAWNFDTVSGLAKIANEITRQAAMIGYLNAFMMYTATSGFAVVLVLMVRRKKPG